MLDNYMESNEYERMIVNAVDKNAKFKAAEEKFINILNNLNLDLKAYDLLDDAATEQMYTARDLAYKVGFQNGLRLAMECIPSKKEAVSV